jgi:hypothetical protein
VVCFLLNLVFSEGSSMSSDVGVFGCIESRKGELLNSPLEMVQACLNSVAFEVIKDLEDEAKNQLSLSCAKGAQLCGVSSHLEQASQVVLRPLCMTSCSYPVPPEESTQYTSISVSAEQWVPAQLALSQTVHVQLVGHPTVVKLPIVQRDDVCSVNSKAIAILTVAAEATSPSAMTLSSELTCTGSERCTCEFEAQVEGFYCVIDTLQPRRTDELGWSSTLSKMHRRLFPSDLSQRNSLRAMLIKSHNPWMEGVNRVALMFFTVLAFVGNFIFLVHVFWIA